MSSKYFTSSEFDSYDSPGSGVYMDPELINLLDAIREECNFPFIITSGVRTPNANKEASGKPTSDHLIKSDGFAHAVDISTPSSSQKFKVVKFALLYGIKRIGIGATFVHLGNYSSNPQEVLWTY
jgi:hypothetical protein